MIYTVTFNPSIDYFLYMDEKLVEGKIYRPYDASFRAGGKGINISIVLDLLCIPSKAVLFLGGALGKMIENEIKEKKNIEIVKIPVEGENRINVKIKSASETAFNGPGPSAGESSIRQLYDIFSGIEEDDYVVISGSYCPGVDVRVIEKISDIVRKRKAKLITDLPNLKRADYRRVKPYLIKPNIEELQSIFNEDVNMDNYRDYAEKLIDDGVENIIVSLGKDGSYFCNKQEAYRALGPQITVRNTVGSGDSMLAHFIAAMVKGRSFEQCIRYGEAAGRAKTSMDSLPSGEDVERFYPKVEISNIR